MNGYGICIIPASWALGRWDKKPTKTLWALGPIRFVRYRNLLGNYRNSK